LTPQNALPSTMTLVPDGIATSEEPDLQPELKQANVQPTLQDLEAIYGASKNEGEAVVHDSGEFRTSQARKLPLTPS